MSSSIYEPIGQVGRITFAPPPLDSKSEREALSNRLNRKTFLPAIDVRMLESYDIQAPPNPNPQMFHVMIAVQYGRGVIAKVHYAGCTTFEGIKVLVFADVTAEQVMAATVLDPHFSDKAPEGALVPVARFEPTVRGWMLAQTCAEAL